MRAGVACTFRRYEDGEDPRAFRGRQEEGPGGKPGTGPCFPGPGGFRVSPHLFRIISPSFSLCEVELE